MMQSEFGITNVAKFKSLKNCNSNSDKASTEVSVNESNVNKEQTYLPAAGLLPLISANEVAILTITFSSHGEASSSKGKGK